MEDPRTWIVRRETYRDRSVINSDSLIPVRKEPSNIDGFAYIPLRRIDVVGY